jgi:hypothetical protein
MKKLVLCGLLWSLLTYPAAAKPNEPLAVAWPYARSLGVHQGEYSVEKPARVVAETWTAPEGGWDFEKARSLANLMMNAKRHKRLHKPSPEYVVLNYPNGAVALRLQNARIVSITGLANDWDENNAYEEFKWRYKGQFLYVNDDLYVTMQMYNRLRVGMSRSDVLEVLDQNHGETVSDIGTGEFQHSTYVYRNYLGSYMMLGFTNDKLSSKHQMGLTH